METILLVEDNDADVAMLEDALEDAGADFKVHAVADGLEARNWIAGLQAGDLPALILLDLNVPRVDGLELLAQIRENPVSKDVPVYVWSSTRAPRDVETTQRFNVAEFLVKPADLRDWKSLAQTLCRLKAGTAGPQIVTAT